MANGAMPFTTLSLLVMLLVLIPEVTVDLVSGQKTWCVAKPSTGDTALLDNIHFACSMEDCSCIAKGGICFLPNTLISHASIAMNLYYQSQGKNSWNCHFNGTGVQVLTDPSYGQCKYA
ncbi:major pollen allergen Ole e 10-like [Typha latifolia]|uniref:major pollen allergen Ole e 10-like n=1 Tax=Typha latifolia TaxID=4733 RepID=UPI003C2FC8A3